MTARSILDKEEMVVDVSGIVDAVDLLFRLKQSGARLAALLTPKSEKLLQSPDPLAATPSLVLHRPKLFPFRLIRVNDTTGRAQLRVSWRRGYYFCYSALGCEPKYQRAPPQTAGAFGSALVMRGAKVIPRFRQRECKGKR